MSAGAELDARQQHAQLLERLDTLAQAVGLAPDLLTVCRALLRFAEASVPCNGLFVSLYDPQRGLRTCIFSGGDGEEDDIAHLPPLPLNDSPNSRAILTGEVIITDDFRAATLGGPVITLGAENDPRPPRSALTMPLRVMGRVIGAFEVQSVQPVAYNADHVVAMQMAANLAAIVIENLRLLGRERELRLAAQASENALRQSEEGFRTLTESLPQLVWMSRADGWNTYVNQRWMDYTGLAREESRGKAWIQRVHPDDVADTLKAWDHASETGEPYEVALRLQRAGGDYGWFLVRALPMRDSSGEIVKWFGTCTDINAQKRTEAALQASEYFGRCLNAKLQQQVAERTEQLAAAHLVHKIDQAIIAAKPPIEIVEPALRVLRESLQVARVAVSRFDAETNEAEWLVAVGRKRAHAGSGVRFPITFMGDVERLRRGEPETVQTSRMPPGPERDALVRSGVHRRIVVPMATNGELIGAVSIGIDRELSSEQIGLVQQVAAQFTIAIMQARLRDRIKRQAEELERRVEERTFELHASNHLLQHEIVERRRAEAEADRANRLKSEFLANMSHELRTPLNAILGFADLIHDDVVTPDTPQFKEFVGDILSSGQHLLQLINDVLDLSKVEAGKLDFHPEPVSVDELIGEVLSVLRPTAEKKAIHLVADVDPGLTGVVLDAVRFKQILYNYVSNAIKFTADRRQVTVRVQRGSAGRFRVEVEDTGIGIAPQDIERLFVEFQQLHGGADKRYGGTGLGLALTKQLVEAQGGTVGVKSTFGKGSVFHAELPLHFHPAAPRSLPGAQACASSALEQ